MKILFAASECAPFIKTGGLADIIGALPVELVKNDVSVSVVMPKYRDIPEVYKEEMEHLCHFQIHMGWRSQYCGIETLRQRGVTYYFIDNEYYYARSSVYGETDEEGERFAFFCRAVLEMLPHTGFPDVLHGNDWQTGMIAPLLRTQYMADERYAAIKTAFTIHNLKYQGVFPWMYIDDLLGLGEKMFTPENLEFYGAISFMKGGIVFSDAITTVSPTYAKEIQTPFYGERMGGLIEQHSADLIGILNGIDNEEYNPKTDKGIAERFDAKSPEGKEVCKRALQAELGLEQRDVPVIALITRMTEQKGLDLIDCVLDDIMRMDVQFVAVGRGEERYQELFSWAAWRYSGRLAARIEMNTALVKRVYAGADILLMPSQFEPCGIVQMIAMRYGTIPVVRETGGLIDTVEPYNKFEDTGTGFSFANYNAHEMLFTLEQAVGYYHDEPLWNRLVRRAMKKDFSFKASAKAYIRLYRKLTGIKIIQRRAALPKAAKAEK